MTTKTLEVLHLCAAVFACVAGWCVAVGTLRRYGLEMAILKKFVSWKSLGAAAYAAVPMLVHAAFPHVSLDVIAAAELFVAVHLFHIDPKSLPAPADKAAS